MYSFVLAYVLYDLLVIFEPLAMVAFYIPCNNQLAVVQVYHNASTVQTCMLLEAGPCSCRLNINETHYQQCYYDICIYVASCHFLAN